jgi:hypothetical protein
MNIARAFILAALTAIIMAGIFAPSALVALVAAIVMLVSMWAVAAGLVFAFLASDWRCRTASIALSIFGFALYFGTACVLALALSQ